LKLFAIPNWQRSCPVKWPWPSRACTRCNCARHCRSARWLCSVVRGLIAVRHAGRLSSWRMGGECLVILKLHSIKT